MNPFMAFTNEKILTDGLVREFGKKFQIPEAEIRMAAHAGWEELLASRSDMEKKGEETLAWMKEHGKRGIVLAGRPYHVDPEIHHGIPELIASYALPYLQRTLFPYGQSGTTFSCHRPVDVSFPSL